MNSWGTEAPLERSEPNVYVGNLDLRKGSYEFKVADSAWSEGQNFGAAGDTDVAIGSQVAAQDGSSTNFSISIPDNGTYAFKFIDEAYSPSIEVTLIKVAEKKSRVANDTVIAKEQICPKWDGKPVNIDVSGQFNNGDQLRDALTGNVVTVKDGNVTVTPGKKSNGLILSEKKDTKKAGFSWDNATVYFAVTDRFYNGNTKNDLSYGRKKDGKLEIGTFHGGDIAGITQKLDYIQSTGADAIWITPPFEQIRGWVGGGVKGEYPHYGYHGYWTHDFTRIDKNFGTEEEFATFIHEAHKQGIRVLLDVVLNHPGYHTFKDIQELNFGAIKKSSPIHNLAEWTDWRPSHGESWHDSYTHKFTGSGKWKNWWGKDWIRVDIPRYDPAINVAEDELKGSLSGLPDFKTESTTPVKLPPFYANKETNAKELPNAAVKDYLITWLTDWVRKYGIDGFRVDTAKRGRAMIAELSRHMAFILYKDQFSDFFALAYSLKTESFCVNVT